MENVNVLLLLVVVPVVSLAVGAALYEAFLQFTGRLVTKTFNPWTFPAGHTNPPPPPPKDNWVRDGGVPELAGHYYTYLVIVEGEQLLGVYLKDTKEWVCWKRSLGRVRVDKVEAWQRFPDYEKI